MFSLKEISVFVVEALMILFSKQANISFLLDGTLDIN